MLTPDALSEVYKAFKKNKNAIFVYTNSATFREDGKPHQRYNPAYGWKYRPFDWQGKKLDEAIAFPPTPSSIRLVYWSPNHIRAWKAKDYWKIGGHNANLLVGDDHDLVCRFYLEGEMHWIDKCLYVYREHKENSVKTFNAEIQRATHNNQDNYLYQLIFKWAERNKLPMYDLGGAFNSPDNFLSVDIEGDVDVKCDFNKGLPFDDNSVGVIRAFDFLEHTPNQIESMNEIYRVLAPNGWLLSFTPSTDGRGAWQDPSHISYWNEHSFWYYTDENYAKFLHGKIKCRFMPARLRTEVPQKNIPYTRADLMAIKDEGEITAGLKKI
jgi:hypothetical protein